MTDERDAADRSSKLRRFYAERVAGDAADGWPWPRVGLAVAG